MKNNQYLFNTLHERSGIRYGNNLNFPLLLLASIQDWCVNQFGAWGTSVGMETFIDGREDGAAVVLGGKVLVIDVDFAIDPDEQLDRRPKVVNIKTSNALVSGKHTKVLLLCSIDNIQTHCDAKKRILRDLGLVASIRKTVTILGQLRYLVLLDGLASRRDDRGIRWFTDLDELYPTLNGVARSEANLVAS